MKYRVHKSGTIHYLAGCCKRGQKIKEDNFFEVYTKEEAFEKLKAKNVVPNKCPFCKWFNEKEEKKL